MKLYEKLLFLLLMMWLPFGCMVAAQAMEIEEQPGDSPIKGQDMVLVEYMRQQNEAYKERQKKSAQACWVCVQQQAQRYLETPFSPGHKEDLLQAFKQFKGFKVATITGKVLLNSIVIEASSNEDSSLVEWALRCGADLHMPFTEQMSVGRKAFLNASHWGRVSSLRILLKHGVSPDEANSEGITALMLAASMGKWGSTRLLLERCAEVNAHDRWGGTALTRASKEGYAQVVQLLLSQGAVDNEGAAMRCAKNDATRKILTAAHKRAQAARVSAHQSMALTDQRSHSNQTK